MTSASSWRKQKLKSKLDPSEQEEGNNRNQCRDQWNRKQKNNIETRWHQKPVLWVTNKLITLLPEDQGKKRGEDANYQHQEQERWHCYRRYRRFLNKELLWTILCLGIEQLRLNGQIPWKTQAHSRRDTLNILYQLKKLNLQLKTSLQGVPFPGSSVVKTRHFHCHGPGSGPGWGTKIPPASSVAKNKEEASLQRKLQAQKGWDCCVLPNCEGNSTKLFQKTKEEGTPPALFEATRAGGPSPHLCLSRGPRWPPPGSPAWLLPPSPSAPSLTPWFHFENYFSLFYSGSFCFLPVKKSKENIVILARLCTYFSSF